jgi:hypothetical protein
MKKIHILVIILSEHFLSKFDPLDPLEKANNECTECLKMAVVAKQVADRNR